MLKLSAGKGFKSLYTFLISIHFHNFSFPAICSLVKCPFNGVCSAGENGGVKCSCIRGCPRVKDVVCADNRMTYYSDCAMKKWSCENKIPLKVLHKGNCGKNICNISSNEIYNAEYISGTCNTS